MQYKPNFSYESLVSSKLGLYVLRFVGHRFLAFTFSREVEYEQSPDFASYLAR